MICNQSAVFISQEFCNMCAKPFQIRFSYLMFIYRAFSQIQPLSPEETITYVARIEGLWSEEIGRKRRKAGSCKRPEKVVMRCRWFYLPSETGFPCSTSANDLYLSNHFDDGVHVRSLTSILCSTLSPEYSTSVDSEVDVCRSGVAWPPYRRQ